MPEEPNPPHSGCQAKPPAGEPLVPFPERCLGTLQAILDHLKSLAQPGAPARCSPAAPPAAVPPADGSRVAPADSPAPGASDLSRELTRTVRGQMAVLERRLEALTLLVVINDWPMAQRLWWDLAFDLRMPLLQLSFLRELSRRALDDLRLEGQSLADVLDRIGLLYSEIEFILIQRTDLIELSNVLEYRLSPELRKLRRFLESADALANP